MSIKKSLALALFILANAVSAQQSLNDYKYVIVPKKYDFLKYEDQYQLNSLIKFLFQKEGFETVFDNDSKSNELANNPCSSLNSKVKNNSNMFATKLTIELINCKNEVIFTSEEGKSKQKEFKKAYQEALRNAFTSITLLDYKYNHEKIPVSVVQEETVVEEKETATEKEVIPVKVETAVKDKDPKQVVEDVKPEKALKDKEPNEIVEEVKPVKAEKAEKVVKDKEPIEVVEEVKSVKAEKEQKQADVVKEDVPVEAKALESSEKITNVGKKIRPSNLLYAQANTSGYQLVDSTPKVVYIMLRSSKDDIYILKDKDGIVFKDGQKWFVEYYKGTKQIKEELNIKF